MQQDSRFLAAEEAAIAIAENAVVASGVVLGCVVVTLGGVLLGLRMLVASVASPVRPRA
jgi:hypothetical protein